MKCSVIICTHNPRENYLLRVLAGLQTQTLPLDQWELVLIDNASTKPLVGRFDLSWHPHARHIREEELGLTPARLRGIGEARAEILIFVDDDNVLAPDYLEQALMVGEQWPFIGAWGGSLIPEFEIVPPSWCLDQAWRLAILDVKEDVWSNLREGFATIPAGAGMCVRKSVGMRFVEWCQINKKSKTLDRAGTSLSGYGDVDLAHCALDIGLGTGKSTRLHLTHLIPSSRLTLDYFVRHSEGDAVSFMMFRAIRGLPVEKPDSSFFTNVKRRIHRLLSRKPKEFFTMEAAARRGFKKGWEQAKEYRESKTTSR
jgi:glycosyltransferase involved in cell wall biosynthesis